jgi:hypothetical protein
MPGRVTVACRPHGEHGSAAKFDTAICAGARLTSWMEYPTSSIALTSRAKQAGNGCGSGLRLHFIRPRK